MFMTMIHDRGLIHFACIAKGTTVLAEFNSKDAALGAIALKCLANTPQYHSTFTHTVRSKTYAFLIEDPFVYFAIFDEKVENAEGMSFLNSVREAFCEVSKGQKKLENLSSHCFQGEFNPVFHQLLGPGLDHLEVFASPEGRRIGESGILQGGQTPIRGRNKSSEEKGLMKMKNRLLGKFGERKDSDGDGVGLSREFSVVMQKNGGLYAGVGHQKAKKIWKKHVWVVLSLDLIICVALFAVWLWVCSGFQCVKN